MKAGLRDVTSYHKSGRRQVCRTWRAAIQDVGLWRHHLERLLTQPMWAHWHEELQIKRPSLNATAADLYVLIHGHRFMLAALSERF